MALLGVTAPAGWPLIWSRGTRSMHSFAVATHFSSTCTQSGRSGDATIDLKTGSASDMHACTEHDLDLSTRSMGADPNLSTAEVADRSHLFNFTVNHVLIGPASAVQHGWH